MSETQIRTAGLAIDVPFESGSADPERLEYADLGSGKQWDPPEGWEESYGMSGDTDDAGAGSSSAGTGDIGSNS